jgi:hypothetical protein
MASTDEIVVELLDDGRVKVTTGRFSAAVHRDAEKLLSAIADATDATPTRERATHGHTHDGAATHTHAKA